MIFFLFSFSLLPPVVLLLIFFHCVILFPSFYGFCFSVRFVSLFPIFSRYVLPSISFLAFMIFSHFCSLILVFIFYFSLFSLRRPFPRFPFFFVRFSVFLLSSRRFLFLPSLFSSFFSFIISPLFLLFVLLFATYVSLQDSGSLFLPL